jgi:hypothetical protein
LILRHFLVSGHSPDLPTILSIFGCCDTPHRQLRGPNDPAHPIEGFDRTARCRSHCSRTSWNRSIRQ